MLLEILHPKKQCFDGFFLAIELGEALRRSLEPQPRLSKCERVGGSGSRQSQAGWRESKGFLRQCAKRLLKASAAAPHDVKSSLKQSVFKAFDISRTANLAPKHAEVARVSQSTQG